MTDQRGKLGNNQTYLWSGKEKRKKEDLVS
jgi:hypothetical protein